LERAWHEYDEARKDLARRDADSAAAHLQKAVEMAPQFEAAWNTLGTIAYQTRKYARAEEYFGQANESRSLEARKRTVAKVRYSFRFQTC